jgi:hypothetical protein
MQPIIDSNNSGRWDISLRANFAQSDRKCIRTQSIRKDGSPLLTAVLNIAQVSSGQSLETRQPVFLRTCFFLSWSLGFLCEQANPPAHSTSTAWRPPSLPSCSIGSFLPCIPQLSLSAFLCIASVVHASARRRAGLQPWARDYV